ncbi:MAG: DUF2058 domain-containing protein [Thioalkalivibrio sp.]|nr:MAG: DUF2058 domain-containing protein [Thioalkalivibrio sp.]
MAGSLKDQLLKAGVASRKQAKEAELEKRRKRKKGQKGPAKEDVERAAAIEAARREKLEKDRELNERRKQEQAQRAQRAEVRQLAEQHAIQPPRDAELRYNFVWRNKVHSLWIDPSLRGQLASGTLALVATDAAFVLVPAPVGERIRERDPEAVVQTSDEPDTHPPAEDDPYADFPIPDDLHW